MKIVEIRQSIEQCNEAGWYAYDIFIVEPLSEADIFRLKPMGDFLYLSMLKAPFFKIDGDYFHVKGIKGKDHFRIAVHKEHRYYVEEIKVLAKHE